jgi:type II restriction enzyme
LATKSSEIRRLITQAIQVLSEIGLPLDGLSNRRKERMAMALLAVSDVKNTEEWALAKNAESGRSLKTRDVINFVNEHFEESLSSGSYDDIRRQDLKLLTESDFAVNTGSSTAKNNPNRGYALDTDSAVLVRSFGTERWSEQLGAYLEKYGTLKERLASRPVASDFTVNLPSGQSVTLGPGGHNELQQAIIADFLPRFGYDADVLYLGDASNKNLVRDDASLIGLGITDLDHGYLPDVIAVSEKKNWLFFVEAVFSSGPIDDIRRMRLTQLAKDSEMPIVFVTAFLDRATFRKFTANIAWETEVWIAEEPDHLIHFDGHKFLGPFESE